MVQTLPKDIQHLKQGIREFIDNEVEPHAMLIEETNEIPQSIMEKSKQMGLFALSIPEEYGGLGIGMVGKCAVLEEVGRTHNGYTTVIGGHTGIGGVGIVEMGNEEQKAEIPAENGERGKHWCFCFNRAKCRLPCDQLKNNGGTKRRPLHFKRIKVLYNKCRNC